MRVAALGMIVLAGFGGAAAQAQTIFPLDRATILAGSHFDLKIEFPAVADPARVRVTINGKDVKETLGEPTAFITREDNKDVSSLLLRGGSINDPGTYEVTATDGDHTATVKWEVFAAAEPRRAKNVILMIGDGMAMANVTGARILARGIDQGKYRGTLALDTLPQMATVGTSGSDSIVTDSANSQSAYNTGHKSAVNALGVYASRAANTLEHPKVETLGEVAKRKLGIAVGIVTNTEIQDATPAGVFAHTRRRADYVPITQQMLDFRPEVAMGGGSASFLPRSTPGSRRSDETDMLAAFRNAGYAFADTRTALLDAQAKNPDKLLGLFHLGNMDGVLDRLYLKKGTVSRFPDQPDLTEEVTAALRVLEKNPNGFYLMIESGLIDKFNHPLDPERSIYETILLDQTLKVVLDWMGNRNDTLLVVVPDHTHGVGIVGTIRDDVQATDLRDKVGTYQDAGFPNYPPPDELGYPPSIDVSHHLAMFYAAFPDYYETYKPNLDGPRVPAVRNGADGPYVANEKMKVAGAQFREGNLPRSADSGVHSADDALLRAAGPGSERFRGFVDNTFVFRVMAESLGLGRQ